MFPWDNFRLIGGRSRLQKLVVYNDVWMCAGGRANPLAASLGGVGVGAAGEVYHEERRVGLRRHPARDIHAVQAQALRTYDW